MGKTPLIKEFTRKYEKEIKLMKRHKAADGVEKNEDESQEAAFETTFESCETIQPSYGTCCQLSWRGSSCG